MIYFPENNGEPKALEATIGVKFSNNIYLSKAFLDQRGIVYSEDDLEDGPFGKCVVIRRDLTMDSNHDEQPTEAIK